MSFAAKPANSSMANQLISPPEFAPPSVKHLPLEKRVNLWADLVDECEAFLLSGLRERIGRGGDLEAAYREWYSRYLNDHEQSQIRFLENLTRREAASGN